VAFLGKTARFEENLRLDVPLGFPGAFPLSIGASQLSFNPFFEKSPRAPLTLSQRPSHSFLISFTLGAFHLAIDGNETAFPSPFIFFDGFPSSFRPQISASSLPLGFSKVIARLARISLSLSFPPPSLLCSLL